MSTVFLKYYTSGKGARDQGRLAEFVSAVLPIELEQEHSTENKQKVQTSIPKYCPFGPTDPVGDSVNGGPLPPITWD